jgi:hypothetical protein
MAAKIGRNLNSIFSNGERLLAVIAHLEFGYRTAVRVQAVPDGNIKKYSPSSMRSPVFTFPILPPKMHCWGPIRQDQF